MIEKFSDLQGIILPQHVPIIQAAFGGYSVLPPPDLTIAPDGRPYLFRWHLFHNNAMWNTFFHMQVASDPDRPLHDHPWDSMTVMLAGWYIELYRVLNLDTIYQEGRREIRTGDTVFRPASQAHRLILPEGVPYTMTIFSTGPKYREWGFRTKNGWEHNSKYVHDLADGTSINRSLVR